MRNGLVFQDGVFVDVVVLIIVIGGSCGVSPTHAQFVAWLRQNKIGSELFFGIEQRAPLIQPNASRHHSQPRKGVRTIIVLCAVHRACLDDKHFVVLRRIRLCTSHNVGGVRHALPLRAEMIPEKVERQARPRHVHAVQHVVR